jgi:predicted TIM-barrel fold metal-dependent hydrolase
MWRFSKNWRALRMEVPWVDSPPIEIIREHVRLTLQPIDAPDRGDALLRVIEHLGSDDMLLYSSDYPHWQFDGDQVLPDGIPAALRRKILVENPRSTYSRLGRSP